MRHRRLLALVALTTGAMLGESPPARAECIEVDLAIHVTGQPDWYPLGPDYCVTDTPWNQTHGAGDDVNRTGLPPGTPSGVLVHVWPTIP